jgi:hypothetical protein
LRQKNSIPQVKKQKRNSTKKKESKNKKQRLKARKQQGSGGTRLRV